MLSDNANLMNVAVPIVKLCPLEINSPFLGTPCIIIFRKASLPFTQIPTLFILRSSFAVDGANCTVNNDVERVLKEFHKAKKPIG